jgi:hypothetical protein
MALAFGADLGSAIGPDQTGTVTAFPTMTTNAAARQVAAFMSVAAVTPQAYSLSCLASLSVGLNAPSTSTAATTTATGLGSAVSTSLAGCTGTPITATMAAGSLRSFTTCACYFNGVGCSGIDPTVASDFNNTSPYSSGTIDVAAGQVPALVIGCASGRNGGAPSAGTNTNLAAAENLGTAHPGSSVALL